jgi:hypothetical protein
LFFIKLQIVNTSPGTAHESSIRDELIITVLSRESEQGPFIIGYTAYPSLFIPIMSFAHPGQDRIRVTFIPVHQSSCHQIALFAFVTFANTRPMDRDDFPPRPRILHGPPCNHHAMC